MVGAVGSIGMAQHHMVNGGRRDQDMPRRDIC